MLNQWDVQVGKNLAACHGCAHRQRDCRGACACMKCGRDITQMSEAGDCPVGLHERPPTRGLGDTVANIAKAIGADKAASFFQHITGKDCGCARRREKLNGLIPYSIEQRKEGSRKMDADKHR
jgi:hypothetical protein